MTNRELTSVAIKVFAIYVIVQTIFSIPSLTTAYSSFGIDLSDSSSKNLFWVLGATSIVLLLVISFFLWKLANQVVTKVSGTKDESKDAGINDSFLLSLLGVYLCIDGIVRFGFVCISAVSQTQDGGDVSLQTSGYIIGYLFQIVVSLTLILKASGWARFLVWLRGAGLTEKP